MTTTPLFEFHLTFDDIDDADALMRHLEARLPGRPVQVDIRGGDTRTVSVTITPPTDWKTPLASRTARLYTAPQSDEQRDVEFRDSIRDLLTEHWTPTPGPLTDQVVELLEAHPDFVFRPTVAADLLDNPPKLVATAMSTLASKGRIRKLGRGEYQARHAAQDAPADLRDQIHAWLTDHDTGSARRIADQLDTTETVVKAELARMTEAGITRIGGRGWVLCTASDTAERHKARRMAAVEAM